MVGSAMALDMAGKHQVTLTDKRQDRLTRIKDKNSRIQTLVLDVTNTAELKKVMAGYDLVISAVPGFLGYKTLASIIEAGKNVVDISFFPEDALVLDSLAKAKNVTAIVDCGVAPGMDNLILGRYNELLTLTDFECLVGGLPKARKWPFSYKAPFSPIDIIEEYTRPARYVENGHMVVREPLSECEYVSFEKAGTLEAFNTDGLRSILFTMPHIKNMKEKTLRYPGHVEYIRVLKESGFFSHQPIEVNGSTIIPLEVTSKILFDDWELGEQEPEMTVMRVSLTGTNSTGQKEKVVYDLHDEYDPSTQTSSMARTTGYTATAAANMFLDVLYTHKGVCPPELIGKEESCFNYILQYLEDRNIFYQKSIQTNP